MPGVEKLTVQEFAKRAGITRQRVYQLLTNRLQPFTVIEDGRTFVLSTGIDEVLKAREKQGFVKSSSTVEQLLTDKKPALEKQERDRFTAQIDELRERLHQAEQAAAVASAERDAERKRADENAATIATITAALVEAQKHADNLAQALQAQQALNAGQIRLALTDAEKNENFSDGGMSAKRSLFSRIFGKKT